MSKLSSSRRPPTGGKVGYRRRYALEQTEALMHSHDDIASRVGSLWAGRRIGNPPAQEHAIAAFEATHAIVLPPTLRAVYARNNGTTLDASDLSFLCVEDWRVERWATPVGSRRIVVFADFMIATYFFGFVAADGADEGVFRGDADFGGVEVTRTVSSFFRQYLTDPDSIHRD